MFIRVLRGDGSRHAAWRVRLDRRHGAELDDEPRRPRGGRGGRHASLAAKMANFAKFLGNFCKLSAGSFSFVSKRNFARKYAFDSSFQALQDLHPFAPLQSQNFRKKSA